MNKNQRPPLVFLKRKQKVLGLKPIFKKLIDKVKKFAKRKSGGLTMSLAVEKNIDITKTL